MLIVNMVQYGSLSLSKQHCPLKTYFLVTIIQTVSKCKRQASRFATKQRLERTRQLQNILTGDAVRDSKQHATFETLRVSCNYCSQLLDLPFSGCAEVQRDPQRVCAAAPARIHGCPQRVRAVRGAGIVVHLIQSVPICSKLVQGG